jgi:hypothetical protein
VLRDNPIAAGCRGPVQSIAYFCLIRVPHRFFDIEKSIVPADRPAVYIETLESMQASPLRYRNLPLSGLIFPQRCD